MVNVNKHVREEAKQRFKQILLDGAFPEIDYKVTENGYTQKLQNIPNGTLAVIKDNAFKRMFNKPIPEQKICFVEIGMLTKMGLLKK